MTPSIIEHVARAIAMGLGDDFDHAFTGKAEWNAERGKKGGRFRDINEPFQADYRVAAQAAILAMLDRMETPSDRVLEAGMDAIPINASYEDSAACSWSAMLAAFREEITNGH